MPPRKLISNDSPIHLVLFDILIDIGHSVKAREESTCKNGE